MRDHLDPAFVADVYLGRGEVSGRQAVCFPALSREAAGDGGQGTCSIGRTIRCLARLLGEVCERFRIELPLVSLCQRFRGYVSEPVGEVCGARCVLPRFE